MSQQSTTTTTSAAPWDRLRAWIDQQEAWERQHGSPAPLSAKELSAIFLLIPPVEEPDVSAQDYVSLLNQYIQAESIERPEYVESPPVMKNINGVPQTRWLGYYVIKPGNNERVPCEGYGLPNGQDPYDFSVKKNAKKYAAQHALQYIKDRRNPSNRGSCFTSELPRPNNAQRAPSSFFTREPAAGPDQAPGTPPSARAAATAPPLPTKPSPAVKLSPGSSSPPSSSKRIKIEPTDDLKKLLFQSWKVEDEDDNPHERVMVLAGRLNFDQPSFVIEPEEGMPNYYRGMVDFKPGCRIPEEYRTVRQVLGGKAQVKRALAEKVLPSLEWEYKMRQETLGMLLQPDPDLNSGT